MDKKIKNGMAYFFLGVVCLLILSGVFFVGRSIHTAYLIGKGEDKIDNVQFGVCNTPKQAKNMNHAANLWDGYNGQIKQGLVRSFFYNKKGNVTTYDTEKEIFAPKYEYSYDGRWEEYYELNAGDKYTLVYDAYEPVNNLKMGFVITNEAGDIVYADILSSDHKGAVCELTAQSKEKFTLNFAYLFNESLYQEYLKDTGIKYDSSKMTYPADGKFMITEIVGIIKEDELSEKNKN